MRTITIGDIHGCSKALDRLIGEIKPREYDRLIFLGDYVDRGPDSKGVIERLLDLRKRCNTICLLGNHEIIFRSVVAGFPVESWLAIGGLQTLASYGGALKNVPLDHIEFLCGLRPYFETDQALFIHANYDPNLPLSEQSEQKLFWEHLGASIPGPHYSGKHVYLGHTPRTCGEVGHFGHLTCVDTFCVGGGWLTAIEVESGEIWQVSQKGRLRKNWRIMELLRKKLGAFRVRTLLRPQTSAR